MRFGRTGLSKLLDEQAAADAARDRRMILRTAAAMCESLRNGETHVAIREVLDLLGEDPPPPAPPARDDPAEVMRQMFGHGESPRLPPSAGPAPGNQATLTLPASPAGRGPSRPMRPR